MLGKHEESMVSGFCFKASFPPPAATIMAPRLSAWVDKKIQDMLGEQEESTVRNLRDVDGFHPPCST